MTTTAGPSPTHALPDRRTALRAALATVGAVVAGAAPHVLHHAGPLAGAAIIAGASGKLLFGAVGLLLAVPMLRRVRRRTGSWRAPAALLAAMAAAFSVSAFVIGPALTSSDDSSASKPTRPVPALPAGVSESEHEAHHR